MTSWQEGKYKNMKTILIIAAILAAFIIAGVIVCLCAADINELEEDKDDETDVDRTS